MPTLVGYWTDVVRHIFNSPLIFFSFNFRAKRQIAVWYLSQVEARCFKRKHFITLIDFLKEVRMKGDKNVTLYIHLFICDYD